jgi:hypothetical protein
MSDQPKAVPLFYIAAYGGQVKIRARFLESHCTIFGIALESHWLSRSPSLGAGDSFCTCYPLCLKKLVWTSTPAPGSEVPVNVNTLSTPISVLFREPVRTELNQVLAVVRSLFCPYSMDVEVVLHLRFSSFRE